MYTFPYGKSLALQQRICKARNFGLARIGRFHRFLDLYIFSCQLLPNLCMKKKPYRSISDKLCGAWTSVARLFIYLDLHRLSTCQPESVDLHTLDLRYTKNVKCSVNGAPSLRVGIMIRYDDVTRSGICAYMLGLSVNLVIW